MSAERRHVLQWLAAAPLAAGMAASAGCAREDLPDPIAAWRDPGAAEEDPRRHALAHAILAPNPHNMQPWLVALDGEDRLRLSLDPTRLLPKTDPFGRQILIGCGAFLELFDIAAREAGFRAEIALFPEGAPGETLGETLVADARLTRDAAAPKDALYAEIVRRRTNREPYDVARIPAEDALAAVAAAAGGGLAAAWTTDAKRVAALRDIVFRGWTREMQSPPRLKESVDVMRVGKAEIARHRDGIALDFPFIGVMKALGQLTPEKLSDPNSAANKEGAKMWRAMAETAPAFLWLTGADNARATQIAAGRAYARANLQATALGLAMHPWSMALQEYPEMADLYAEQQAMLGASAAAPAQMLVRIGHAKDVAPAPRRGLDAHIKA